MAISINKIGKCTATQRSAKEGLIKAMSHIKQKYNSVSASIGTFKLIKKWGIVKFNEWLHDLPKIADAEEYLYMLDFELKYSK